MTQPRQAGTRDLLEALFGCSRQGKGNSRTSPHLQQRGRGHASHHSGSTHPGQAAHRLAGDITTLAGLRLPWQPHQYNYNT